MRALGGFTKFSVWQHNRPDHIESQTPSFSDSLEGRPSDLTKKSVVKLIMVKSANIEQNIKPMHVFSGFVLRLCVSAADFVRRVKLHALLGR